MKILKSKRQYLQDGSRIFSTGCYLVYDKVHNCFLFDGLEDDTYYDGKIVNFENNKPFIGE